MITYKSMKGNVRFITSALIAFVLLGSCSQDDGITDEGDLTAVIFQAGIQATRTTGGGDKWTDGDKVGLFMLETGGSLTTNIISGADNLHYNITDAVTGALSPAGIPAFYPQTGQVDFIAYYPYGTVTNYNYTLSVDGQTSETAQNALDVLYSNNATALAKSDRTVNLAFTHVLSKISFTVKPGDGFTSLTGNDMAEVRFSGMPQTAILALDDGTLTAGTTGTFPALKTTTGTTDATFTALLIPQEANTYTNRIAVFTVNGEEYTWKIPDSEVFEEGIHYIYPVTVNKEGVTVGACTISLWSQRDNGTGTLEVTEIQPEANSYIVRPGGNAILIPISRANKAADPAYNLGADATGLGGVTADNYTVELVWSDTPVGAGGVIEDMYADGEYVYVRPGIAGNAVICIKVDNIIKWSWHIWVTEPVGWGKDHGTGVTWMDRNLGATSATPLVDGYYVQEQWIKTLGVSFQWGRKDALPGLKSIYNPQQEFYTPAGKATILPADKYGNIPGGLSGLVQNPLVFILADNTAVYQGSLPDEAGGRNDSWGNLSGSKTIYDPCPYGWKIPPLAINGAYLWGMNYSSIWSGNANYGRRFQGTDGRSYLNHFYPFSGYREGGSSGLFIDFRQEGRWGSDVSMGNGMAYSLRVTTGGISPADLTGRCTGVTIRCISE